MSKSPQLPKYRREEIERAENFMRLARILDSVPGTSTHNTPAFRRFEIAYGCTMQFIGEIPDEKCAFITLTTRLQNAKKAQKRLARIMEKRLRPFVSDYVAFFHRTKRGYVHLHVIAAFLRPILEPGAAERSERALSRHFKKVEMSYPADAPLTGHARKIARGLSIRLHSKQLGYRNKIEPVDFPEALVSYVCRYIWGIAVFGPLTWDKGVRMFSRTRGVRSWNGKFNIITDWGRLQRAKTAAFAAASGAYSLGGLSKIYGSRWAYHKAAEISALKLRSYPTETDYRLDWGRRWSPEALGIKIFDPNYSRYLRKFFYIYECIPTEHVDLVTDLMRNAAELPEGTWRAGG